MKESRTLYLVADGGRARLIERTEAGAFKTRRQIESSDIHRHAHELASSRPGRAFESANTARHAMEPRVDPKQKTEETFIRELGELLRADAEASAATHLVLAAPARVLGPLREALGQDLSGKVRQAISKDLTNVPDHDLASHLPVITRDGPVPKPE